jgi:hypothetical protein
MEKNFSFKKKGNAPQKIIYLQILNFYEKKKKLIKIFFPVINFYLFQ